MPVVAASSSVAVLRRGDRGRAHRAQVPHAGLPPLRRLPGQRLRAVADPRRRPTCRTSRRRFARGERRAVPALPPRSRDARPAVGDPRHAGPRAPDRRAREGRRHRQHLLRPRQPRRDGAAARAEGRAASPRTSPSSTVDDPDGDASSSSSAGARRTARSRPRVRRARRAGRPRRARALQLPEPAAAQHRRRAAPLPEGARSPR